MISEDSVSSIMHMVIGIWVYTTILYKFFKKKGEIKISQLIQYEIIDEKENKAHIIYLTPEDHEKALSGKKYNY